MRKLGLLVTGIAVFLTGFAVSTAAFANHVTDEFHDPDCGSGPSGYKPIGIYEAKIRTQSTSAHTPSNTSGSGNACSGEGYRRGGSTASLFQQLDVEQPPGVEIANTLSLAEGSYVGQSCIGALSSIIGYIGRANPGDACPNMLFNPATVTITIDNVGPGRQCPEETRGPVKACFEGRSLGGFGSLWAWHNESTDRDVLTVGRFNAAIGEAGLTRIEPLNVSDSFNPPFQCAYVAPPGSTNCGNPKTAPLLFRTGNPVPLGDELESCIGLQRADTGLESLLDTGSGVYKLKATRRDGQATAEAPTCMPWQ